MDTGLHIKSCGLAFFPIGEGLSWNQVGMDGNRRDDPNQNGCEVPSLN